MQVEELVRELGETQPVLRGILDGAVEELQEVVYSGRRLLQRETDYHTHLRDALSQHPVQAAVGMQGIPGLSVLSCEALCEAVSRDGNSSNLQRCDAYAFRRDHPETAKDLTGHCWILTSSGTCKPIDFAAQLYVRNVDSESICDVTKPGRDNEMCIGLPATRQDTMVMTHGDAAAIAAQTPSPAAPGSGGLPMPRSTLEAMCAAPRACPSDARLTSAPPPPQAVHRLRATGWGRKLLVGHPRQLRRRRHPPLDHGRRQPACLPRRRAALHPRRRRLRPRRPHVRHAPPLRLEAGLGPAHRGRLRRAAAAAGEQRARLL